MLIAAARIGLVIPARSLKEKRRALRSLIDRAKSKFDVRISEVGVHDTWSRAQLGFAVVGTDRQVLETLVDRVVDFVHLSHAGEVQSVDREMLHFGDAALEEVR